MKHTFIFLIVSLCSFLNMQAQTIKGVKKINSSDVVVSLSEEQTMTLSFYGDNIFRIFQDNAGGEMRRPEASPDAHILLDNPKRGLSHLTVKETDASFFIETSKVAVMFDKATGLFQIKNIKTDKIVVEELAPVLFGKGRVTLTLKEGAKEYFYGGGVQNGRFSHKGRTIAIENQNSWTDGGVASPVPLYWSTNGYGVMYYTFKKGNYDFGATEKGVVSLSHETDYLDVFFMINDGAIALLNDYYQLTGKPVLLPKFGFYEGHLNAYNRDYWKEDEKGFLFEDGKRYKESQKDDSGIKESLNGEKDNYQFSARAVIDRYKAHDMPLGWLLPNDGYGAGYGQAETLDGNIANLKKLADYAHKNGVEIGLWTQSDLHPKEDVEALLQRDIVKEVRDAGVRVLKTDVAWVGAGYSFGLNGLADVANIMPQYGSNARPFIISLDGWAGTQRYAGIWSGDQTGGSWEYIRFHIPTYIGAGLSGMPNICSDMDGIFGGKNQIINTRDFQWKTFTPMQLNMDGWGANEKYPHAFGEPVTSINRMYLKMKSELIPYAYSIAKEATDGLPMVRAMFLEYPSDYTLGKTTQYQYMYGDYFLVAPIYQDTKADEQGNDVRNGIYLPEGTWIDYLSGEEYEGNRILNDFASPLWKLPVFVKSGAIIPMTKHNNNVGEIDKALRIYELYPDGNSSFTEYDDDGKTEEYRDGKSATTLIESKLNGTNLDVIIHQTQGDFSGFVQEKATEFKVNTTSMPTKVSAIIGSKKVKLAKVKTLSDFNKKENVYYYDIAPNLNRFSTKGSDFENVVIPKNPQLLIKLAPTDITTNKTTLKIEGFEYNPADKLLAKTGVLVAPESAFVSDGNTEAYTLKPTWSKVDNADYYEIKLDDMLYSTIKGTELLFEGLNAETAYEFNIRSVNKDGHSDWFAFEATTKSNPLEFAIKGVVAEASAPSQGSSGANKLFDFDEGNNWHTKWGEKAVPFDVLIDLRTINTLEKFQYLPRKEGKNGILLKGKVYYSNDKKSWNEAGAFEWANNNETKVFTFDSTPTARFLKLSIERGSGDYGSGREMYVFKIPNTPSYTPGDINNDGKVDGNDLTSYINYTGLRRGDADFEGYISIGDINKNGLIDAYDISNVAIQMDGGIEDGDTVQLSGNIEIVNPKESYDKGDMVELRIKGVGLQAVNALSFALPYNSQDYEFVGIEELGTDELTNLTNDRLHTNGVKSLYPTFVNLGDKKSLSGTKDLFVIKLRAKRKVNLNLKPIDIILVDKDLNQSVVSDL
ncbi:MAG: TIM-barrel domain-containing protein [Bacteroidales bacterium]